MSPSKSTRKETAEPIAKLLFAPSIQIRTLLGIPRVNFNEGWYYIYEWAAKGASITGAQAVKGFGQTIEMRKTTAVLFSEVDALLTPTNPIVSFPAEWAAPTNDPTKPFEHIAFTVPWNMSEQPAASINCGFSASGMPIGLQIVGPRYHDLLVLRLSKLFETWTGGVKTWPQPRSKTRAVV